MAALSSSHTSSWPFIVVIWCAPQSNKSSRAMRTELFTSRCVKTEASADRTSFTIFAFDEGRTLPNLLGYLWSRRCPVHASESWPVFFRSIGRPFIFSAPFWMTSQFRCAKDAASCIAVWQYTIGIFIYSNNQKTIFPLWNAERTSLISDYY